MPNTTPLMTVLCVLLSISAVIVTIRQSRRISELELSLMDTSSKYSNLSNALIKGRDSASETTSHAKHAHPAPTPSGAVPVDQALPASPTPAAFKETEEAAEVRIRMVAARARAALDVRYADLFKRLNLQPAQLEQLKKLLVERDTARADVASVASRLGMSPASDRENISLLTRQAVAEIELNIGQLLGPDGNTVYQRFQDTTVQRFNAKQLEQSLSYTPEPLTSAQSDRLVDLMHSVYSRPSDGATGRSVQNKHIPDEVISSSAAFLSPVQMASLKELQNRYEKLSQGVDAPRGSVPSLGLPGPR